MTGGCNECPRPFTTQARSGIAGIHLAMADIVQPAIGGLFFAQRFGRIFRSDIAAEFSLTISGQRRARERGLSLALVAMKIRDWFKQALRQDRAPRLALPGVVAYFWDGGAPKEHPVKDISLTGAYLYVTERWCAGTIMEVALHKLPGPEEIASGVSVLCVRCRVVRHGEDGIGIAFVYQTTEERQSLKRFMNVAASLPRAD